MDTSVSPSTQNDTPADNPAAPPSVNRLLGSILIVMGGLVMTKGVTILQVIIIANRFGAGSDYDTYTAAENIPTQLIRFIGGGALAVAFIPVFSTVLGTGSYEKAWRLASQVFNTLLVVALTVSLIIIIITPWLVHHVVAPGFDNAEAQQTIIMLRILLASTILFSLSGLVTGILQSHNHFLLPALAPVFQDLGLLFGVVVFVEKMGIYGLAWGSVLGASLHFAIQIPGLVKYRARWFPELGWRDPQLQQVVRLMIPRALIGLAIAINWTAFTNVASRMGEGAISAFSWGYRFMDIPESILGTAVGIVIFPTLSVLSNTSKVQERLNAFSGVVRFILFSSIPAAAGVVLVANPTLRLLFDAYDTALIYTCVQIFSIAIVIQSLHEILTRSFYAEQDTFHPLIYSAIATLAVLITLFVGYQIYKITDPPLWSPFAVGIVAVAYVVWFVVEVGLLAWFLRKRWHDIALPDILRTLRGTLAATVIMVIAVLFVDAVLKAVGLGTYNDKKIILVRVSILSVSGAITYITAAWFIGIHELQQARDMIMEAWQQRRQLDKDDLEL